MTAARFSFLPPAVRVSAVLLAWLAIGPSAVAQEVDSVGLRRDSLRLSAVGQGQEPAVRAAGEEPLLSVPVRTAAEPTMTFTAPDVSASAPPYYVNPSPLFRGDYSTGGVVLARRGHYLLGSGSRTTMAGLGVQTEAGLTYVRRLNDRLYLQASMSAAKLSMAHLTRMAAGFDASLRWQAQDHLWFTAFGGLSAGRFPNLAPYRVGGTVGFDAGSRFSLELGAQSVYDPATGRWTTLPVVIPTYRFSEKFQLGFDVGPLIYQLIRNAVDGRRWNAPDRRSGPTIRPQIPGYMGRWGAP